LTTKEQIFQEAFNLPLIILFPMLRLVTSGEKEKESGKGRIIQKECV